MTKNKKIAILSQMTFGYMEFVVDRLNQTDNVDLTYINIYSIPFKYKNIFSRIGNFFSKLFLNIGLKDKNRTNYIKNIISKKGFFDQILVVGPDNFQEEALVYLRRNTHEMNCFLWDGFDNYNKPKSTLLLFDQVFSYDRKDAAKYNFTFLNNYIYDNEIKNIEPTQTVFNISTYDKRFRFLEKIANYLEVKNISFLFITRKNKKGNHKLIKIVDQYMSLHEVKKIIASSLILIDIQKDNQSGLSFRVFEALGYQKKLITSNADIVNYDFYNENNIFVISEENYEIPLDFFKTEYVKIDSAILEKYSLKSWVFEVFKIDFNEI
jgi:hypothetical protein